MGCASRRRHAASYGLAFLLFRGNPDGRAGCRLDGRVVWLVRKNASCGARALPESERHFQSADANGSQFLRTQSSKPLDLITKPRPALLERGCAPAASLLVLA